MLCSSPGGGRTKIEGVEGKILVTYPCGYCPACLITKRQMWTLRIMLEMREHEFNYFITLTYSDQEIPPDNMLSKEDLQLYWKRLRKALPHPIRYFAVGEYGEQNKRPHYHAIVFSDTEIPLEYDNLDRYTNSAFSEAWYSSCIVDVRPIILDADSGKVARYVAGYVLKKYNNDGSWVPGIPEFATSSRRPGIGLGSSTIEALAGACERLGIYPSETLKPTKREARLHMLRMDGKLWPTGRTLRDKIISNLGGDVRKPLTRAIKIHMDCVQQMADSDPAEQDVRRLEDEAKSKMLIRRAKKAKQL